MALLAPVAAAAVEDRVAIWISLAVGASALAATIVIHTLAVTATITVARQAVRGGHAGTGFWVDVAIVAAAILFTACAHLFEIGVWALTTTRPSTTRPWVTETSS